MVASTSMAILTDQNLLASIRSDEQIACLRARDMTGNIILERHLPRYENRGVVRFVYGTGLVSLLRKLRELVENGVWTVREDEVEGEMEFYREAEDPETTDWFVLREECFDLGHI